jgi:hypothetical protein
VQENGHQQEQEDPTEGSKNMDEVVDYPLEAVLKAARQAMETYGCDIVKERVNYLEGTRGRHLGLWVGSGGEKVKVNLSEKDGGTRVRIETGKGFYGRLGKNNWSTPIFNETMRILKEDILEDDIKTRQSVGQTVETYRALHRPAGDLLQFAEQAMGDDGRVTLDSQTETLILSGSPVAVDRTLALLEELDR